MATVKAVLAALTNAVVLRINTITAAIKLVGAVFVAKRVLASGASIELSINHVATMIPAALHTVATVSGLGQACTE
jgi:hypothetical protein